MKHYTIAALALVMILLAAACGGGGLPDKDGIYPVQSHSVTWDGDQYRFAWADSGGALHQVRSKDVRLVQDDRTFLQVQDRKGILHLASLEPVNVLGQDQRGQFSDSWFPFLVGATIGNALGGSRTPSYYYPPTNVYGRGDQIDGSIASTAAKPPDYSTVRPPPNAVHPASGSVAGQSSGTGGGNAATNKLGSGGGSSAGSGSAGSVGGQSGGTGNGSAAGNKAGSPSQSGGSGAPKSGAGSSAPRSGGGSGGRR